MSSFFVFGVYLCAAASNIIFLYKQIPAAVGWGVESVWTCEILLHDELEENIHLDKVIYNLAFPTSNYTQINV